MLFDLTRVVTLAGVKNYGNAVAGTGAIALQILDQFIFIVGII
jgi:hypothetical protein